MKTPDLRQLIPVAAVVLAVCVTANVAAWFVEIEPRAERVVHTLTRAGRAAASVVTRAFDPARRVAEDADGDECE